MKKIIFFIVMCSLSSVYAGERVLGDSIDDVEELELKYAAKSWPKSVLNRMIKDQDYRHELLLQMLLNKKLAKKLDSMKDSLDEETTWQLKQTLQDAKYKFYLSNFVKTLPYPDFGDLSEEFYKVDPEKYAKVEEKRFASHIFFKCLKGSSCKKKEALARKTEKELNNDKEFYDLVELYSEDDLTDQKKGKLAHPISKDNTKVDAAFKVALFNLEKVGDASGIIRTKYGYHLIKLEKIEKSYLKKYEEVKEGIILNLKENYKNLSLVILKSEIMTAKEVKFEEEKISGVLSEIMK